MTKYLTKVKTDEDKNIIRSKIIKQKRIIYRNIKNFKIDCASCEEAVNYWYTVECLFCGLVFCRDCAKHHFK